MREQGRSGQSGPSERRLRHVSAGRSGVTERHQMFGREQQLPARRETMKLVDPEVCHCRGWSSRLPLGGAMLISVYPGGRSRKKHPGWECRLPKCRPGHVGRGLPAVETYRDPVLSSRDPSCIHL